MFYIRRQLWFLAGVLGFLLCLATISVVTGQTARSQLTITPPVFELTANPGDRLKHTIRLTNSSPTSQEITVDVRNFTALGERGSVSLTDEDTSYSLKDWVTVSPSTTTLAADSGRVFSFTINVPLNAEPGGHFGSVVFRTADLGRLENSGGAAIQQEIAALVLVKVAGKVEEKISIVDFGPRGLIVWRSDSIELDTRLSNDGNVHLKPRGVITIKNIFGKEKAVIPLEEQNVLPDSIRNITTTWKPEGFSFGYYRADLNMVYGVDNNLRSASASFWILPVNMIILLLVIVGLVVFVSTRYRDRIILATKVLLKDGDKAKTSKLASTKKRKITRTKKGK